MVVVVVVVVVVCKSKVTKVGKSVTSLQEWCWG